MTGRKPKNTPETLIGICDTIASGIMAYSKAAAVNGLGESTLWEYIKRSQAGDEEFLIEYLGETILFHKAINAARRIAMHEMRGRFEQKNLQGWDEIVYFQGEISWQKDRRCIGIDDPDLREMLFDCRDGLLRNERGETIPNVIHHHPPIAGVLFEVAFPQEYRPTTNSNVNVQALTGFAGVGVGRGPRREDGRPIIPPLPPLPQLEVLTDDDELTIPETEDDDPLGINIPEDTVVDVVPEIRVMVEAPPPAAPTNAERSGAPMTALQRDLIDKMNEMNERNGRVRDDA